MTPGVLGQSHGGEYAGAEGDAAMELFLAVLSVLGTLGGTVLGYLLPRRVEQKKKKDDLLFGVYMKLLAIYESYFWIASGETHQHEESERNEETKLKINKLAWEAINDLRRLNDHALVAKVLGVLLEVNDEKYPTALSRYEALGSTLDKLGEMVTPQFQKAVRAISQVNMRTTMQRPLGRDEYSNAPASLV